jgi:hypothetical protein
MSSLGASGRVLEAPYLRTQSESESCIFKIEVERMRNGATELEKRLCCLAVHDIDNATSRSLIRDSPMFHLTQSANFTLHGHVVNLFHCS